MAEAAAAPVLELKGLTVQLPRGSDRAHAIEKITLSVGAGEIVCVVGESGSGKSVTAQAVMGLLPRELAASAGEARLQGEDVLKASPSRLRDLRGTRMAMIFQEPMTALNPVMRVGDQIAEVLEIHTQLSESDRRQRVLQIMRLVHLPEPERMIGVYPHQLSGGQRQRIMIAAALVLDPALLIADEPTTALDVTTQAQILRLLEELQAEYRFATLFVTHDLGVVAHLAHRVAVMYAGCLVESAPTRELFRAPAHPYTQGLLTQVPRADVRAEGSAGLEGLMPVLAAAPTACPFRERCPKRMAACEERMPVLHELAPDHAVACHLYGAS
jgi:peptide/nickel transport system ATP-binding protein